MCVRQKYILIWVNFCEHSFILRLFWPPTVPCVDIFQSRMSLKCKVKKNKIFYY